MGQQKEVVTRKDRLQTQTAQSHMEGSISLALSPSLQGWQRDGVRYCVFPSGQPLRAQSMMEKELSEPAGQIDVKKKKRCPALQPIGTFLDQLFVLHTGFIGLSR